MNVEAPTVCYLCQVFGWNTVWRNLGLGLTVLNLWACSALDRIGDSKMHDLQLSVDVLNVSLKDAQRTMAELRAEVELRNQELSETQISRAQLEGRVREAEHRLSEARQVIGLQREELAESRANRERVARTGAVLQNQLKQLRKHLSKIEKQVSGGVSPTMMEPPAEKQLRSVPVGIKEAVSIDDPFEGRRVRLQSDEAMTGTTSIDPGAGLAQSLMLAMHSQVRIKHGDTLWSLAQRYRLSVHQLMAINALPSDYIQAGQNLWLPESGVDGAEYERR
jgi:hypothetical protein